jgi:hypothetical protein
MTNGFHKRKELRTVNLYRDDVDYIMKKCDDSRGFSSFVRYCVKKGVEEDKLQEEEANLEKLI